MSRYLTRRYKTANYSPARYVASCKEPFHRISAARAWIRLNPVMVFGTGRVLFLDKSLMMRSRICLIDAPVSLLDWLSPTPGERAYWIVGKW